uniref:Uncharacterized protein n=1 Tax=Anguilla anguilla TaxID=7936 RepID=A0A0E9RDY6_ANGAN
MLKQERAFPKLLGKHRTMKNSPRSRGVQIILVTERMFK